MIEPLPTISSKPPRPTSIGVPATLIRFPGKSIATAQDISRVTSLALVAVTAVGIGLRLWNINSLGYNSDEAVYAGQGAALASDPELTPFFPIIRAHPMLFQFLLSLVFHFGVNDLAGRLLAVGFGIATILLVAALGQVLYSRWVGVSAALFMAVMPYHVIVTRQVLLDGPMTFFATLTLYLVARFATTGRPGFLAAAGASLGLVFFSKETGLLLAGAVYAFLALSPQIRVRIRDLALSIFCLILVMGLYPASLAFAGGGASDKAKGYAVWQLFRRPNHTWDFYLTVVPPAIGLLVILVAVLGLWRLRRQLTWRETLLVSWIVVPIVVFQLYPVKGFQYLLPTAPAFSILAAQTLANWRPDWLAKPDRERIVAWVHPLAVGIVALSLVVPSWQSLQAPITTLRLAGGGGIPGGRELGTWIRDEAPEGAVFLTVGPSMANIIQFYGHRKAYGLSVSPNPLHRNPSYEPVINPDAQIRNGEVQYLVYDAFSAARSATFANALQKYVDKYAGREVHAEYMTVPAEDGTAVPTKVIIVFEVQPQ